MNIYIDTFTSGGMSGGYQKYLFKLIPHFIKSNNITKIFLNSNIKHLQNLIQMNKSFNNIIFINEKSCFSKNIKRFNPDLIFIPTGRSITLNSKPIISMIRNMEPLISSFSKESICESLKNYIRKIYAYNSCIKSTKIIAVSNFVKDYLVNVWHIPDKKIEVIYHGIDITKNINTNDIPIIFKKIDKYIFTAGSIRPNRGLEDILFSLPKVHNQHHVIIAGNLDKSFRNYQKKLMKIIKRLNINNNVHFVGNLNESLMLYAYRNAKIFIMSSRVEACPNIALEAMASGCLLISADNPPLPEFFINSAIYYPPKMPHILTDKINEVLSWSIEKKNEMRNNALRRASDFSWGKCANQTVNLFQKTIDEFKHNRNS